MCYPYFCSEKDFDRNILGHNLNSIVVVITPGTRARRLPLHPLFSCVRDVRMVFILIPPTPTHFRWWGSLLDNYPLDWGRGHILCSTVRNSFVLLILVIQSLFILKKGLWSKHSVTGQWNIVGLYLRIHIFIPKRKWIILSQLTQPNNQLSKVITLANQEKWPIGWHHIHLINALGVFSFPFKISRSFFLVNYDLLD